MNATASAAAQRILDAAATRRRALLLESDAMVLLDAIGIAVPRSVLVRDASELDSVALSQLPGDDVMVKVQSSAIGHKSDVGGVVRAAKTARAIGEAIEDMQRRLGGHPIDGFLIAERVVHDGSLGGELLVGARWTDDFGPVVVFGSGGTSAEALARGLRPERATAILRADPFPDRASVARIVAAILAGALATEPQRGAPPRIDVDAIVGVLAALAGAASSWFPESLTELEVNPLVVRNGSLVALDALARPGGPAAEPAPPRPTHAIRCLLEPERIAIAGVSRRINTGRAILRNVLASGFDPARVHVVKPGGGEPIDGCACVESFAALPEPVDLAVLSISAADVAPTLLSIIDGNRARSVIVISGGLEEKRGTGAIVARVHAAIRKSRSAPGGGPIVNGGNCLGVRSIPGRYDTLFIPHHKMPAPRSTAGGPGGPTPLALISQSGAHLVACLDRLAHLEPRYAISVGNQTDLTVGDYLTALADDPEVAVVATYVEGFRPGDGRAFVAAAERMRARGGHVVLYRAGRSAAGARATASHTASIAGDHRVTRALAEQAGVIVVDALSDFAEVTALVLALRDRPPRGRRLGALSNAGFECVAIADALGPLALADLAADTRARLATLLAENGVDDIVDVQNPLDLTPMLDDAAYRSAIEILMADPGVDVGVVGCVPLTPALATLPASDAHREDLTAPDSVVSRMVEEHRRGTKPWVAVVEGGARYDPMARRLEARGVPTFRSADRAVRALGQVVCAMTPPATT